MAYKQPSSGSFKMMGSSPAKAAGIFTTDIDELTGKETERRISSKEAETAQNVRWTGDDIPDEPNVSPDTPGYEEAKKQLAKVKRKNIAKMKKEGTYKADQEAQKKIEEEASEIE